MFLKWKILGREADWSDIKSHKNALEYFDSLVANDQFFISEIGSGIHSTGECSKSVHALQEIFDAKDKVIGIESYGNY